MHVWSGRNVEGGGSWCILHPSHSDVKGDVGDATFHRKKGVGNKNALVSLVKVEKKDMGKREKDQI